MKIPFPGGTRFLRRHAGEAAPADPDRPTAEPVGITRGHERQVLEGWHRARAATEDPAPRA